MVRYTLLTCLYCVSYLQSPVRGVDSDIINHEDHNHHRLLSRLDTFPDAVVRSSNYEPEFAGLDRGIIGRAPEAVTALSNNAPQPMNIDQGDVQYWTFPKATLQGSYGQSTSDDLPLSLSATNTTCLEKDLIKLAQKQNTTGGSRDVWLTLSTCDQPILNTAGGSDPPPQLEVYVSLSQDNRRPDNDRHDQVMIVEGGYGSLDLSGVTDDIWIGVRAPKHEKFGGLYNYELAASIDAPYATYFKECPDVWDTQIKAWDTDTNSALLGTGDITNALSNSSDFTAWMSKPPPFSVYVTPQADPIQDSNNSMVNIGGQPIQLFYVKNLTSSSHYNATMILEPRLNDNATIGGGGAVWTATSFTTKSDKNCQIIYSLPFCTDVAYAVPSNLTFNTTQLALTYDTYANNSYQNFSKSLQQIPCDTTPSAQYSLARNCQDCDNAYKTWLCAVTIPRCADFSSPSSLTHLLPRNINASTFINNNKPVLTEPKGSLLSHENRSTVHYGSSRNKMIDEQIRPGPYKEMLPCKDLCYHLMQNCPAALQFACPTEERGMNFSYGHYSKRDTEWLCNWPGGKLTNGVGRRGVGWGMMGFVLLVIALFVL
ncbi:MAG: hypothetical protein Q9225_001157 [Loekoesia sp. 1 TL-2023]